MNKKQRKADTHARYVKAALAVDQQLSTLSQVIVDNIDEPNALKTKLTDAMYAALEKILSVILAETKKSYKSFDPHKPIKIDQLLYTKDGKTLQQRVKEWIDVCSSRNQNNSLINSVFLLNRMNLILHTEAYNMVKEVPKHKCEIIAINIVGDGDCCDDCALVNEDEIFWLKDNPEEPPFHPDCACETVEYDYNDLISMGYTDEDLLKNMEVIE